MAVVTCEVGTGCQPVTASSGDLKAPAPAMEEEGEYRSSVTSSLGKVGGLRGEGEAIV